MPAGFSVFDARTPFLLFFTHMDSVKEKKEYELAVLTVGETEAVAFGAGIEMVQKDGPKPVALGYAIKKHQSAFLWVYVFNALPSDADELNKIVSADQGILRHLMVTPAVMSRRREPAHEAKSAQADVRPVSPEAVSNEALEAALENILETKE